MTCLKSKTDVDVPAHCKRDFILHAPGIHNACNLAVNDDTAD